MVSKKAAVCAGLAAFLYAIALIFLVLIAMVVAYVYGLYMLVFTIPVDGSNNFDTVNVTTNTAGMIIGRLAYLPGEGDAPMHEFFNIPYAAPPTGNLRFQPPQPLVETSDSFDASSNKFVGCIQTMNVMEGTTEDCLVLSVRSGNLTASKPVIVWIHGGNLINGYGGMDGYSFGSELTHSLDAVTVNINYRLGFLGFHSVEELWNETAGVYANNGIRDQVAALEWIQANIDAFGGDPDSITILGQDAGGTSVLALLSSPLANNKFHRAVALSPAPEFRFDYTQGNNFQRYTLTLLGCTQDTLEERRTCLMELDASSFTFLAAATEFPDVGMGWNDFPMKFGEIGECIGVIMTDPVVVPTEPANLKDAQFSPDSPIPVILSNLAQETSIQDNHPNDMATLNATFVQLFAELTDESDILSITHELYPALTPQMMWDTLTTDMRATCPTNDLAQAMSESANHQIYRLYITNDPAYHWWDTTSLFGDTSSFTSYDRDYVFEEKLVGMLKSLAKNGAVEEDWGTFPGKTMVYGNSDEVSSVQTEKPQEDICTRLESLDLVKYGWQN